MFASPASDKILRLQKKMMLSMRFHQRKLLEELPRDLALQAMNEAYESCQTLKRNARLEEQ